jgi:hypothetical protein
MKGNDSLKTVIQGCSGADSIGLSRRLCARVLSWLTEFLDDLLNSLTGFQGKVAFLYSSLCSKELFRSSPLIAS